jgi:hypothetical protein
MAGVQPASIVSRRYGSEIAISSRVGDRGREGALGMTNFQTFIATWESCLLLSSMRSGVHPGNVGLKRRERNDV